MRPSSRLFSLRNVTATGLLATAAVLSGCGHGPIAGPSDSNITGLSGHVHGGNSPIQGALVKLWHTDPNATSYGAPGILIGSAISDGYGNFTITNSPISTSNCPAGSQVYITGAGGYQPTQPTTINNNLLEMAALGDCSTVTSSTFVTVNEVTTVAAAYALSGFMKTALDGSNPFYTAYVGAPAANRAAAGSSTPTTPSGLVHAFMNAAALANSFYGTANATTTANTGSNTSPTGPATTATGLVPVAEINTLADMMQPCINSTSLANGAVLSIPVGNGGSGYGASLAITGGLGTGAAGKAIVSPAGAVTSLQITNPGSGYSPAVTFANTGGGTGASITSTLSTTGGVSTYIVENGGSGYGPTITVNPSTAFPGGSGAVINQYTISTAGAVGTPTITSGGTGYGPLVTFSASSGSGAAATATLSGASGAVTALTITSAGSGYPQTAGAVTVNITSPASGTTATATATVGTTGQITALAITSGGTGYTLPTLTFSAPTSGTTATDTVATVVGGVIKTLGTITTSGGSGYGPTLTVTASPSGTTATATATVTAGVITAVGGTSGTGYSPTLTITGAGTGATGTASVGGGAITALNLTAGGSGYGVPTVTVAAPSAGTTATATATTANGVVTAINVTNGGAGYTSAPTVTISAPTSGTTATAGTPTITGGSGSNVAPNTSCASLFALTPSISGVIPNNTVQSFINLARNPYPSAAAMNPTTGLLGLASGTGAFQPILSAVPNDWSMAVSYETGFSAIYWEALDANDTVYLGLTATSTALPLLQGLSVYGVSVPTFGSPTTGTTARGIAADLLGNIWATSNGAALYKFSASSGGAPTVYTSLGSTYDVAVDANNNVWTGNVISSGTNIEEFAYTPGTGWALNYTAAAPGGVYGISVDAQQNVWAATYYTSAATSLNTEATVLPNVGTVSSPNYNASAGVITPVTATFSDSAYRPYGIVFDASGNAWYDIYGGASTSTSGIEEVVPNSTTNITSLTPGPFILGTTTTANGNVLGASVTNLAAIDGAETMFIGDNVSPVQSLVVYNTATNQALSPTTGIAGCYLATSTTTTCTTASYNPREPTVDSTGSVWAGVTTGGVVQFIGLAAPSYPVLAVGKPGLSPGLTAANPLP
jgi:hypothetical protein